MTIVLVWLLVGICCVVCWRWAVTDKAAQVLAAELANYKTAHGLITGNYNTLHDQFKKLHAELAQALKREGQLTAERDECRFERTLSDADHMRALAKISEQQGTIERQGSQIVSYETKLMTQQRHIERLEASTRKRRS